MHLRLGRTRVAALVVTLAFYLGGVLLLSLSTYRERERDTAGQGMNALRSFAGGRTGALLRRPRLHWCSRLKYRDPIKTSQTQRQKHKVGISNWFSTSTITASKIAANSAAIVNKGNSGDYEKPVALVSFPGSGNTWMRYLLQQATGILTGSVYKDHGLMKSGFPAEQVRNSSVLVVKTHEWGPEAKKPFSKAILLVRSPAEAILAEFNRQSGGHIGFASIGRYKRAKGKYWQQFVSDKLWAWEQTNLDWAKNFTGPIEIIHFDKLVESVEATLRKVLNFLEYPIDEALLSCAVARKEGIYRRNKKLSNFDPFSDEMKMALMTKREIVYRQLGIEIINNNATNTNPA